jgi:DNA-directed RNA polymerase beta subunit
MDVSPQAARFAAGLIPFLEHDDITGRSWDRNMQHKCAALISGHPLVGADGQDTEDSRVVVAEGDGVCTATAEIIVTTEDGGTVHEEVSFWPGR